MATLSLRKILTSRLADGLMPPGYKINMGIVMLCGRRPASIFPRLQQIARPKGIIVHFKSLRLPIGDAVNRYFDAQFIAMQRLFAESAIAVIRGTTEDLSGVPALDPLDDLDVGTCSGATAEQNTLFQNRNGAGTEDIVVYLVNSLVNGTMPTTLLGCASHPAGQPGCAILFTAGFDWLTAHEVGHVLGLKHVCGDPGLPPCAAGHSDSLMFNGLWTNVPPDLSAAEGLTMLSSPLANL